MGYLTALGELIEAPAQGMVTVGLGKIGLVIEYFFSKSHPSVIIKGLLRVEGFQHLAQLEPKA